ncbi:GNAT family N-acetyltransferase [Candidatus Dojkabacteria bacterium]|nr:GNAT family N-acetyltransferase [Candidatus Dojkabacteria bacterium]
MEDTIKLVGIKDLQAVYKLVRASAEWIKKEYGYTHWEEYYTYEKVEQNFKKGDVYGLYIGNRLLATFSVGYKYPVYYAEEDLAHFEDPKAQAYYLTTLCVSPQHHGKGYAKSLIKHLEKLALEKGVKYIRFDAKGEYTELIEFYKRLDYKIVGELLDEGEIYYLFEKKMI